MGVLLESLAQNANTALVRTSRLDSKSLLLLLLQMPPAALASCLPVPVHHFFCAHAPTESQCARALAAVTATATLLSTCGITWGVLASSSAIIGSVSSCSGAVGSFAIDSTRSIELVGRYGCGKSRNNPDLRGRKRTESRFTLATSVSKGAALHCAPHITAHSPDP